MTYSETIERLYAATPQFQQIGAAAYKPGLETAQKLSASFGNPHHKLRCVHVAGTNGKGSTCHTLAAVMQSAGYKVGLYTSPHLVDFRERIKVNGQMIPQEAVINFMTRYFDGISGLNPSFFELTTIMAFDWFVTENVDIAIIETGLGGRLDTTNIISPILSIITNISFDHTAQLGNTLAEIATEKAGIIKRDTPVIVGNSDGEGVADVFRAKALDENSEIIFCKETESFESAVYSPSDNRIIYSETPFGTIRGELTGNCQCENAATIIQALLQLRTVGFLIPDKAVAEGFDRVVELTGLGGRWMTVSTHPTILCDTAHNKGGWQWLSPVLNKIATTELDHNRQLVMVIGFVNDKDVASILSLMPRNAAYIFTQAKIPRAMQAGEVAAKAAENGLRGEIIPDVNLAVNRARQLAGCDGMIFVGGSTFVVADLLQSSN